MNVLVVRSSTALSHGYRGVVTPTTHLSSSRGSGTTNKGSGGIGGTLAVAGAACTLCNILRTTATCSASTTINLRHVNYSASSTISIYDDSLVGVQSLAASIGQGRQQLFPPLGQWNNIHSAAAVAAACNIAAPLRNIISQNTMEQSSRIAAPLQCTSVGIGAAAAATVFSSSPHSGGGEGGWSSAELLTTGTALLFAAAAAAASVGSIFLGPNVDDSSLRGKKTNVGGGGGGMNGNGMNGKGMNGNGGGSGGSNNNSSGVGGGGPKGDKYQHSFDSLAKEQDDKEDILGLKEGATPRAYEVSVRALRGGRLSMEDEFIVVAGGRLSAVFDGHGGGGVSQYLRDRLHIIISEKLFQQEMLLQSGGKLKKFMKSFKTGGDATNSSVVNSEDTSSKSYDISRVGNLPMSAVATALQESFDQVDNEVLRDEKFEYQGSTAVATLLHEATNGTRTLLSANIGDSRGVLSRNGNAVDLTRDHKPNDKREKARIFAMGEKIEWDHYCKVHRVRNLSLSRAVGDKFAKPAVSGEVEIKCFPIIDGKDEFIILASDGLWDVMSSQEVVTYVHKRLKAQPKDGAAITCDEDMACLKYLRRKNMSRFIANEALRRGSGDNISVVLVWLTEFDDFPVVEG